MWTYAHVTLNKWEVPLSGSNRKHRCKCTCCEGTFGLGKLKTCLSPDVLCSGSRRFVTMFIVWLHVSLYSNAVTVTFPQWIVQSCGNPAAALLLFCNLHKQNRANLAELTCINNLKALFQSFKQPGNYNPEQKRHKKNTGNKKKRESLSAHWLLVLQALNCNLGISMLTIILPHDVDLTAQTSNVVCAGKVTCSICKRQFFPPRACISKYGACWSKSSTLVMQTIKQRKKQEMLLF